MYHRNIVAFVQAADCGSFTKAAEQYFTTAASLMKQVNALEGRVGTPLFVRTPKGLTLTPAGESLYEDAVAIIQRSDDAFNRARNKAGSKKIVFRVGSSPMNPCNRFMDVWSQIEKQYPQYVLEVVPFIDLASNTEALLSSLGKDMDFIIGTRRCTVWHKMCSFLSLGENNVSCAIPLNHRLATKERLELTDLYGEELILAKGGEMDVKNHIFEWFSEKHPQIRVHAIDPYDFNAFNMCAKEGKLLLVAASWTSAHPAFVNVPINWDFTTPYGIIYSKNPNAKMSKFIEILTDEFGARAVEFF